MLSTCSEKCTVTARKVGESRDASLRPTGMAGLADLGCGAGAGAGAEGAACVAAAGPLPAAAVGAVSAMLVDWVYESACLPVYPLLCGSHSLRSGLGSVHRLRAVGTVC